MKKLKRVINWIAILWNLPKGNRGLYKLISLYLSDMESEISSVEHAGYISKAAKDFMIASNTSRSETARQKALASATEAIRKHSLIYWIVK